MDANQPAEQRVDLSWRLIYCAIYMAPIIVLYAAAIRSPQLTSTHTLLAYSLAMRGVHDNFIRVLPPSSAIQGHSACWFSCRFWQMQAAGGMVWRFRLRRLRLSLFTGSLKPAVQKSFKGNVLIDQTQARSSQVEVTGRRVTVCEARSENAPPFGAFRGAQPRNFNLAES